MSTESPLRVATREPGAAVRLRPARLDDGEPRRSDARRPATAAPAGSRAERQGSERPATGRARGESSRFGASGRLNSPGAHSRALTEGPPFSPVGRLEHTFTAPTAHGSPRPKSAFFPSSGRKAAAHVRARRRTRTHALLTPAPAQVSAGPRVIGQQSALGRQIESRMREEPTASIGTSTREDWERVAHPKGACSAGPGAYNIAGAFGDQQESYKRSASRLTFPHSKRAPPRTLAVPGPQYAVHCFVGGTVHKVTIGTALRRGLIDGKIDSPGPMYSYEIVNSSRVARRPSYRFSTAKRF